MPINKAELLRDLSDAVVNMDEEKTVAAAQLLIDKKIDAYDGIEKGLADGMERAGQLFEEEEYFIPELLLCSDAMYAGLEILKPHLRSDTSGDKTKIVIGVVEGDTHDIGKNIVKIMLETAGYELIDLGRDVPPAEFVSKAVETGAKIIAASTLMTTTMDGMGEIIRILKQENIRGQFRVIIGGGPISRLLPIKSAPTPIRRMPPTRYARSAVCWRWLQLLPDLMTPLQRMAAYNKGARIDRLPCVPIVGNTAARVIGVKVSALRGNGKLIAEAQVGAYRRFGYDIIRIFTDLYVQAEAMGARVFCPEDETAYLSKPAIDNAEQIRSLQPANPYKDGNLPHHLEAMKIAVDKVGKEVTVTGALTGPFTNASFLIGTENLVRLVAKDPAAVHALCEVSLQSALTYAEAIIDAGCTPSLTDPMSSTTVISPRQYREFAWPYLKRLIDYIHSRGKTITLHVCGKTEKIWDDMCDAGADCLSIDNVASLTAAKIKVGHRARLMGNIKPAEILLLGTPSEVRNAVYQGVAEAFDNPKGYIVASGCSLPTETPFTNIDAMLAAVREIGYPINQAKILAEVRCDA